jgi:carbonic anhydrase/acetyltransferase-like protein (isoleucine patch superfamily)
MSFIRYYKECFSKKSYNRRRVNKDWKKMPLLEYQGKKPVVHEGAWVSPDAVLIGDVEVAANTVIWPGCFLRAESASIKIGRFTTLFDGVVLFTRSDKSPIQIGNYNIIETGTVIFGTFTADYVTIGEASVIYERTSIGEGVVLLPQSEINSGATIAERAIMKGKPAATVREQSRADMLKQKERAEHFSEMFVRIRQRLPNLQPYALTESDLMRVLMEHFRGSSGNPAA